MAPPRHRVAPPSVTPGSLESAADRSEPRTVVAIIPRLARPPLPVRREAELPRLFGSNEGLARASLLAPTHPADEAECLAGRVVVAIIVRRDRPLAVRMCELAEIRRLVAHPGGHVGSRAVVITRAHLDDYESLANVLRLFEVLARLSKRRDSRGAP